MVYTYILLKKITLGDIQYVLKPKKYFTYMYYIEKTSVGYNDFKYEMKEYTKNSDLAKANAKLVYQITFTQDDYVYLNVYQKQQNGDLINISQKGVNYVESFYLMDSINNEWLVGDSKYLYNFGDGIVSSILSETINEVAKKLTEIRKEVISKICMQELSYAVNAHNYYAKKAGVKYNFTFGIESDADWYETVDGVGMVAVVQGISLGNRYLNYSAYSATDLTVAKRYYLSNAIGEVENVNYSIIGDYLYYHSREDCPIYTTYIENKKIGKIVPSFFYNKEEAAANGYKPCFVCKP